METSSVINVLATLLGYIGAEAGTEDLFERILWPQRFWGNFSAYNAVHVALTMSMFGPLHKAALRALEQMLKNGLFKGSKLGHMLGSPFYRDTFLPCTIFGREKQEHDKVRNGFWVRAISMMPVPTNDKFVNGEECGLYPTSQLRSKIAVSRVILHGVQPNDKSTCSIVISDAGRLQLRHIAALVCSELLTILVGTIVYAVWKSCISLLWFCPLTLKLLSAAFAIKREELIHTDGMSRTTSGESEWKKCEIFVPIYGFIVIEGFESTLMQFFRHYGHPIRCRRREIFQIAIISLFGCFFPLCLVFSVLWMPIGIQCLWLGHQIFSTIVMYVYRFGDCHKWATTEEKIRQTCCKIDPQNNDGAEVGLGTLDGSVVSARLYTTFHDRFSDARAAASKLASDGSMYEVKQSCYT